MTRNPRLLLVICSILTILTAQPRDMEPMRREQTAGAVIAYSTHVQTGDSLATVIIPYRIRFDFFVFTRPLNAPAGTFAGSGEISVELIDSTGTSVARRIEQVNLSAADNALNTLRTQAYQDLFQFTMAPGTYTVVISVTDKESRRSYTDKKRTITVPAATAPFADAVPVLPGTAQEFALYNLGGDVRFSNDFALLIPARKEYPSARFSLFKLRPEEDERETIIADSSIAIRTFAGMRYRPSRNAQSLTLALVPGNGAILYAAIGGAQLRQGRYELTLTFPDSQKVTFPFGTRWTDMPAVLNDLDLAIEPLQFIMTKDDYSELKSGGREARIKKFEEFWKKKDRTPATAYNEVMHEFYRRVDHAVTAYRSMKEMNGALTDRGRTYLLFGPPTSTERLLAPDGAPKEIWRYTALNKVFTFEDPTRQGNYKLTEKQ